jgi:tRNA(Leu) C34 or U34 (ribose-2'-O)-methylase TrmL
MQTYTHSQFHRLPAGMAIRHLLDCAQRCDREWPQPEWLAYLSQLIGYCAGHPDPDVQKLATYQRLFTAEPMSHDHFLGMLIPLERAFAKSVADHDFIPSDEDHPSALTPHHLPVDVICDNIRSAFNVGSIFRTADGLGVRKIYLCGYTATPENPKVLKTTMGTERYCHWEQRAYTRDVIHELKQQGSRIIALETLRDSVSVFDQDWSLPCALLLGNERFGLPPDLVAEADDRCHIPMYGRKNSLNCGVAFGIAAAAMVESAQKSRS